MLYGLCLQSFCPERTSLSSSKPLLGSLPFGGKTPFPALTCTTSSCGEVQSVKPLKPPDIAASWWNPLPTLERINTSWWDFGWRTGCTKTFTTSSDAAKKLIDSGVAFVHVDVSGVFGDSPGTHSFGCSLSWLQSARRSQNITKWCAPKDTKSSTADFAVLCAKRKG